MNAAGFVSEWSQKKDTDGSDAVGICVNWHKVRLDSRVKQYFGDKAWKQIESYYTPNWDSFQRTKMGAWLDTSRRDYQQFIDGEQKKIVLYRERGLIYPEFCAFADSRSGTGVMGDGCHRFIDCNYLILVEKLDLSGDIAKCRLDILLADNLLEIISPIDYPPEFVP